MSTGPTVEVNQTYATVDVAAGAATVTVDVPETTVSITAPGPQGPAGTGATGYILQAFDITDQTAANTTTAYPLKLGTVDISNGITVANNGSGQPTRITFANDGDYNVQFSIQFQNTSASEAEVNVWFRKNGVDVADSNSQATVPKKHGSDNGSLILALNLIVAASTSDYVEIMWQTESTDVSIQALPAGTTPTTPVTPSVIVTVMVNRYLELGPAGPGVATGGTTGQYLTKSSNANYATNWTTLPNDLPTGGTTGQVLTKTSSTNYEVNWSSPTNGTTLVTTETIGSGVATVQVTNCFSSTYDSYIVEIAGVSISSNGTALKFIPLVGTTAPANGCYGNVFYVANGAAAGLSSAGISNQQYMECVSMTSASTNTGTFNVDGPNLAEYTRLSFSSVDNNYWRIGAGIWRNTSQYTGFQFETFSGTLTGGTIRVYGYNR